MIKKTLKLFKRAPIPAITVLLFAAVISVIVCALQASNEAELRNYEEAYQAVPVTVTVTESSGINTDTFSIKPWVLDLFTGENTVEIIDTSAAKDFEESISMKDKTDPIEVSLAEYLKDVQIKMSHFVSKINGNEYNKDGKSYLIGMTSVYCDKQLLPEYGCEITWYEGYDESIFAGDEPVCIVPEAMAKPRYYNNGKGEAPLYFRTSVVNFVKDDDGFLMPVPKTSEYSCTLKIVGTYTAGDEKSIYCPYPIVEQVHGELETERFFDSISATIADNRRLEEFREEMSLCFQEPSPDTEEIHWGSYVINRSNNYYNEFYDYALDINDDNLFDLSAILEDSIKFNQTVTVFVVALSVVAGFLVGFLMIRRRKRDIILMRTVGESNARLFFGFILEQMICIILGIAVGGAYYMWHPMDKLAIFAIVYFVALTLALVIFMSKKLIKNIKEDE